MLDENKAYTEVKTDVYPECIQDVSNADTQVRLGKVRLGKGSINNEQQKRFTKPTLDDVKAYCQERNNGVDAEKWYNHYSANGWKVGKNPMKDWKAAVRTWERGGKSGRNSGDDFVPYPDEY
jgi:hypothetical protein